VAVGSLSCRPCPDPCSVGDPCSKLWDPRNTCRAGSLPPETAVVVGLSGVLGDQAETAPLRRCPPPVCTCGGPGWKGADDNMSCRPCDDPCKGDPCNKKGGKNTFVTFLLHLYYIFITKLLQCCYAFVTLLPL
jgi:hypothetical protein